MRTLSRPLRHALLRGFVLLLSKCVRALPRPLATAIGAGVGRLAHALVWFERRRALAHLRLAFPDKDQAWIGKTAREVFAYWGKAMVDLFRLIDQSPEEIEASIAEVHGVEHLMAEPGKGIVIVTSHLGHWELMGFWVAKRRKLGVVARQLLDPSLDEALNKQRNAGGMQVFPRNTSVMPILRWLKEGGALGTLADQDTSVDSLFCEFFGHAAKTSTGSVVLAQACNARLISGYCWRRDDGRYVIEFEPDIPVPDRKDRDPLALWGAAQEYTRRCEAKIRQHPEQWVWMHRRWRSPMDVDSTGWQSRLAGPCRERIAAWVASGRPELKA